MSAGVCGKRIGFEEIFGSPSSPSSSSLPPAKRSRRFHYGSPPTDHVNKINFLLRMFPSMDPEVLETVLKTHNDDIDEAIRSLKALCLGNETLRREMSSFHAVNLSDEAADGGASDQVPEPTVEDTCNGGLKLDSTVHEDLPSWVDTFVQEMTNASDWNDVRSRARRFLEAFEQNLQARSTVPKELEIVSLKAQLQCLVRDNQILKRAVAIQHERNSENEEKLKEVEQLKQIINQYQEQLKALEFNNYTLKLHLQRAQEANTIPNRFHPDVF